MENNLSRLKSMQIKALEKMLRNIQEEQQAIISRDKQLMKEILKRRKCIDNDVDYWGNRVGEQDDKRDDTSLNGHILHLKNEIEHKNKKNKVLVKLSL